MNKVINRVPVFMVHAMLATAEAIMSSRPPDVIIGDPAEPYVHRWWMAQRGPQPNAYIHRFFRSDHEGALHDHRYKNVSVILDGQCHEHLHVEPLRVTEDGRYETQSRFLTSGDVVERAADVPHRIALVHGPMTTIFFTGPEEREWGFHTPDGWVHWKTYNEQHATDRPNGNYGSKT